ncbi:hypothetical protein LGT39_05695 [Demequina sp. TTPB684]|uniref:hypothetical protein n=1 Tax=unclassified Demequina TaxID=2620311 RepID=UPI001CF21D96|nr:MULTISPECIES: hypothetical protein [unclassified Demequina]MCB2412340.1 hypothetical protein [Demequina sp. TTPB684]UPU88507.1 hypothetical protein LGT36_000855 [Demequina sp. TMPB413]
MPATSVSRRTVLARLVILAFAALALSVLGSTSPASATVTPGVDPEADLVLFWGDGCPNCEKEREWLDEVKDQYPDLKIAQYEVWNDADNRDLFAAEAERLDFTAGSVPTTIVGERVWIGWTDQIRQDMAGAIDQVSRGEEPRAGVYGTAGAGTCSEEDAICTVEEDGQLIEVPIVGEVSLGDRSLFVSTVIIGFVDGINPCSLWAISVLLTIVLRTGSRRRVVAIGSTFLVVTAGMYALYMGAIYSALAVVGFIGAIQIAVAVVAGVFGAVSVKDYFAFKKGLSFTISDSAKPGIYQRMRAAAGQRALIPALAATVALAVAVSLLETPCTAGFPVLWTGMLQANGVGALETAGLFVAYMVPFLLDEFLVLAVAIWTMRAMKMQEKHGELLKLFAGVTMLVLAAVMVIDPALMENPIAALALFAGAFALAAAIHAVTERVKGARQERVEARASGSSDSVE